MNISQTLDLDQAADSLNQINWKKFFSELNELWILLWKILVISAILIYISGKSLGNWVHRTNDFLASNWVRMLGLEPSTPAEAGQAPLPGITEEVSLHTPPAVEVQLNLPPANTEVVEISALQEKPPPARRRRRSSTPRSLKETVTEEAEPASSHKPGGRRAHAQRNRAAA